MNISPDEAEEALAVIQKISQKTRRSLANSGAYIFLILTGVIWLVGFLATQFLSGSIVVYIWTGASLLGVALSILLGKRIGQRVRGPSSSVYAKRIGIFWLLLIFFGIAAIGVAQPTSGKQVTMLVILFIMIGQMAMGLLFSFSSSWWAVAITILALAGYFLLPDYFYLWLAVFGGGGMIALALYIRTRW